MKPEMDYFWAKTTADGKPGISVRDHCLNVGCVAEALANLLPKPLQDLLPPGAVSLAALHDVGKITPGFQQQSDDWCRDAGHSLRAFEPNHALVTQCFLGNLVEDERWRGWAEAVGAHHGWYAPGKRSFTREGAQWWQDARQALLLELSCPQLFGALPGAPPKDEAQKWFLAGLTAFADWIGSDAEFFDASKEPARQLTAQRKKAREALRKLDLRADDRLFPGLSFHDIWDCHPYPFQRVVLDAVTAPGVYVIEAPMGSGKTEAALTAAYQLITRGLATGFYFALPTQTTSNRIRDRVARFLAKVSPMPPETHLIHGASWLSRGTMPEWRKEYCEQRDEEVWLRRRWFASARKALVARFGVGTVDQALLGIIAVKHFFVRQFALAGKVVILDEVHSYDAYTGGLLQLLVQRLRELRCTVIVLSATLTEGRRAAFFSRAVPSESRPKDHAWVTGLSVTGEVCHTSGSPGVRAKTVGLRSANVPPETVAEECLKRAAAGQCVLWICNTVDAAIAARQLLTGLRQGTVRDGGPAIGLLHSRFPYFRRQQLEGKWLRRLGRGDDWRPEGCVLVSTQIVEQSVDIDADWMVTELAPTDMLLQRLGRMWRHDDRVSQRGGLDGPGALILAPDLSACTSAEALVRALGKSARVYDPFVLARSWKLWQARPSVRIPGDIRDLLEATYAESATEDPEAWLPLQDRYRRKIESLSELARHSANVEACILEDDVEGARTRVQTLLTTEVVLARGIPSRTPLQVIMLDGTRVRLYGHDYDRDRQAALTAARAIHRNVAKVPSWWLESLAKPDIPPIGEHFFGAWHLAECGADTGRLRFASNDEGGGELVLSYHRDEGVKMQKAPPKKTEYLDDDRYQFDD